MGADEIRQSFLDQGEVKCVGVVVGVEAAERVLRPREVDVVVVFFGDGGIPGMEGLWDVFDLKNPDVARQDAVERSENIVEVGGAGGEVGNLAAGVDAGIGSS